MTTPTDILGRYAHADIAVTLRQSVKRGGELMATYRMDYPSIEVALDEICDDIEAGRVEAIEAGGAKLSDDEMSALTECCRGPKPDGKA